MADIFNQLNDIQKALSDVERKVSELKLQEMVMGMASSSICDQKDGSKETLSRIVELVKETAEVCGLEVGEDFSAEQACMALVVVQHIVKEKKNGTV